MLAYFQTGNRHPVIAGIAAAPEFGTITYDGQDILQQSVGSTVTKFIHGSGIDEPLAQTDAAGNITGYFHVDGLGSIVKMTSAAGAVTANFDYDAWGNLQAGSATSGYAFTGREWDPETNLYYYRARYYEPKVGRFPSEDPIGFEGGENFYVYSFDNPVNLGDPFGLTGQKVVPFTPNPNPRPLSPFTPREVVPLPDAGPSGGPGARTFNPRNVAGRAAGAAAAAVNIYIWPCVIVEAYCASQPMDFCACMKAADLPWTCPGDCEPACHK